MACEPVVRNGRVIPRPGCDVVDALRVTWPTTPRAAAETINPTQRPRGPRGHNTKNPITKLITIIITVAFASLAQADFSGPSSISGSIEEVASSMLPSLFAKVGKKNLADKAKLEVIRKFAYDNTSKLPWAEEDIEDIIDREDEADNLYVKLLQALVDKNLIPESVVDNAIDVTWDEAYTPEKCARRVKIKAETFVVKAIAEAMSTRDTPEKFGEKLRRKIESASTGLFASDAEYDVYRQAFKDQVAENFQQFVRKAEREKQQIVRDVLFN
jgi:hypothetical protein